MINYIERYKVLCSNWNEETTKSGVRKYNKVVKEINKLNEEVRTLDRKFISKLMEILLDDDNPNVRITACCFCLKEHLHYNKVINFLNEVHDNRDKFSWRVISIAFHCRFCIENNLL